MTTLRHGCKIIAEVNFADGCTKKKEAHTWKLVGYDEMAFWGWGSDVDQWRGLWFIDHCIICHWACHDMEIIVAHNLVVLCVPLSFALGVEQKASGLIRAVDRGHWAKANKS